MELRGDDGTPLDPPVMVPRQPEDSGPFYKLYPEGRIARVWRKVSPEGHALEVAEALKALRGA